MAGRKNNFTLLTNTLDELLSSQGERDEAKLAKIKDIPLEKFDNFPDHWEDGGSACRKYQIAWRDYCQHCPIQSFQIVLQKKCS